MGRKVNKLNILLEKTLRNVSFYQQRWIISGVVFQPNASAAESVHFSFFFRCLWLSIASLTKVTPLRKINVETKNKKIKRNKNERLSKRQWKQTGGQMKTFIRNSISKTGTGCYKTTKMQEWNITQMNNSGEDDQEEGHHPKNQDTIKEKNTALGRCDGSEKFRVWNETENRRMRKEGIKRKISYHVLEEQVGQLLLWIAELVHAQLKKLENSMLRYVTAYWWAAMLHQMKYYDPYTIAVDTPLAEVTPSGAWTWFSSAVSIFSSPLPTSLETATEPIGSHSIVETCSEGSRCTTPPVIL